MRTRNFVVGFLVACFMAVFSMSLWGAAIEIYDPDEQENKVVTSDYPLPVIHDALDDATDTNTGIFIKPATGATFDVSGITISDITLTDTSINDGGGSITVDGTFWQTTQPVSLSDKVIYDTQLEQFKFTGNDLNVIFSNSSISTDATLTDTGISVDNTVTVDGSGVTQPVSGTFYQVTQPISGTVTTVNQALTDAVSSDSGIYIRKATTPTIYNVEMTTEDIEYSQSLPARCLRFLIQCRTSFDMRLAFTAAGTYSTYMTISANSTYSEDSMSLTDKTLYFQCGTAGKVAEITVWQ